MRGKKAKAIRKEFKYIVDNFEKKPAMYGEKNIHTKEFTIGKNFDGSDKVVSLTLKTILNPYQNFYRKRKQTYNGK